MNLALAAKKIWATLAINVQRRCKVVSISANSIPVEDMANNNRQTLPLLGR
jgi:hypothetical protein